MLVFGITRSRPYPIFFLLFVLHYKFVFIKLKEGHERKKEYYKTNSIICVWSYSQYNGGIDINKVQSLIVKNPKIEQRTKIYSENVLMPRPGCKTGMSTAALKFVKATFMLNLLSLCSGPLRDGNVVECFRLYYLTNERTEGRNKKSQYITEIAFTGV